MSAIDRTAADGWVLIATPLPLRSFFAAKHGQRLEQKESLQPIGSNWEAQAEWFIVEWLQLKMGLRRCTGTRLPYYSSHSSSKGDTTFHRTVAYCRIAVYLLQSQSAALCATCYLASSRLLCSLSVHFTTLVSCCCQGLSVQFPLNHLCVQVVRWSQI